jgi:hypothetical protein
MNDSSKRYGSRLVSYTTHLSELSSELFTKQVRTVIERLPRESTFGARRMDTRGLREMTTTSSGKNKFHFQENECFRWQEVRTKGESTLAEYLVSTLQPIEIRLCQK